VEIKKDILWRAYLSFIGMVVFSLFVLGRAAYIQNVQGDHWRSLSDSMHQKYVELDAERGTIFSEDGQMLSTSIPFFDIYIDFGADGLREKNGKRFRENLDSFALSLSNLFGDKTVSAYRKELKGGYQDENRYYLLRKGLTFEQYKKFRSFPLVRLGRNKSGVIAEEHSKRLNPFGLLARRTIGLARANAQNVGIERTYDSMLQGQTGKQLVRYIAGGAPIPVEGYQIEPENGKDIYTTLDIHMQDMVESALMKMMQQSQSEHGTAIVMETKTGKIKAIANLGRQKKDTGYSETMNYALQTTEPGSTIKLATLLAVLDHGSSKIDDMVEVGSAGHEYVGVRNVNDAERAPKPWLTVRECFAHSSNVGFAKLAYKAFADKPDVYKSYLQKFHLDKRTGIDLIGEGAPLLPRIKRNKEGLHAMVTAAFGYALQVSPLHTLMLYNAIANDGKMMKPYLVNSIKDNGVTVKEFAPTVLDEKLCKPGVIAAAKSSMEAVVTEGTAKLVFKDYPVPVAGKTGTAHVAGGDVGYEDGIYQASFVGYFPANNPQYTCIVVIKTKPHAPIHFGGQLAAPVFKEIVTGVYSQYMRDKNIGAVNVVPDSSSYIYAGSKEDMQKVLRQLSIGYLDSMDKATTLSQVYASNYKPVAKTVLETKAVMPDVRHMTLRDALYVLESRAIKVTVKGKGKVAAQDILPGTPLKKNSTVTILLN
jgi:cell division protein FtsI (penicillin-binding protein 3)